ncbi:2-oxo acid dehydrogenase subunit E2 [Pseudonocardiaceae bacterium YIM PH 21723]|nr:2-oxo acid dehydrogenase subunit E2 [Pseudonocardiaceae bacterium YIM PH 21723]
MVARDFLLPDLGEGLTEAEVIRWLVEVGQTIEVDQPVAEVETAKAAVEVPSPFGGTVTALHGEPGTVIAVGTPLVSVLEGARTGALSMESAKGADSMESGSGNVLVGYGTGERSGGRRRARKSSAALAVVTRQAHARPRVISPVVRRLAKDGGLDLSTVDGTGPEGLITRADVEQALRPAEKSPLEKSAVDRMRGLGVLRRVPLRGVRRAVADKLQRSRQTIPDATTWVDVDATGLLAVREELRAAGEPVGLLALLARFTLAGLARYPELNSFVDEQSQEIVQFDGVHLGFAAQTDRGLMVPVIRDAHRHNTSGLHGALAKLTEAARTGSLTPADLSDGTFTLNNYGPFGVDGSSAIINHPEVAILGIGRIIDRPWVVDGELSVRKVTQLSLVFDHRVCDGGTAAGFLRYVADCVERPYRLLADL